MSGPGKPFQKGNKAGRGRPRGSRNKMTLLSKALEEHGESIVKQCILLAIKGDRTALQLCIDRLLPKLKPATSRFRLPAVKTKADLAKAHPAVIEELRRGRLTVEESEGLFRVLDNVRRAFETADDRSASGLPDLDLSVLTDEEFELVERMRQAAIERKKP